MSALPSISLVQPTTQPAPRGAEWLTVDAAASRLGVSERRIRQLCGSKWSEAGTARLTGGKWEVRSDADPQLARVLFPEQMPFDMKALTGAQRAELMRRKAIIDGLSIARETGFKAGMTVDQIHRAYAARMSDQGGKPVSSDMLYRWHAAWREQGLAGLCDKRWKRREPGGTGGDPFMAEVKRWWLMPGKRMSKMECWAMARGEAHRQGWPVRSYGAVKRFLATVPQTSATLRRDGSEAFTNDCEPFGERDYTSINSNDWWNSDHSIFDVFVIAPNGRLCRPWITAWQDVRSRRIVGHVIRCSDPNGDAIIDAWRIAALAQGLPRNVLIDNGRDFKSFAGRGRARGGSKHIDNEAPRVASVLESLGVAKVFAKPYHPQSKPIERFFRTMEEQFTQFFPTYTTGRTDTKPEALAGNLKAGKAPTLAQFIQAFDQWLDDGYHHKAHFGDGMGGQTPAAVFDACLVEKRTTTRELLDVMCLKPTKPLRVTQNGVRVDGISYFSIDLVAGHAGRMVTLRIDGRDRTSVMVFEAGTDRFICLATPRMKLPWGATSQELREAHAEKSKLRRKVREYAADVRPRAGENLIDTMLRNRAAIAQQQREQNPHDGGPGPTIKPVRSPFEDQLPAIKRAQQSSQYRQAAGGEFDSISLRPADVAALICQEPAQEGPASIDLLRELHAALRGDE